MIVVFGSLNVDLVTIVEHLPEPGETVMGPDYQLHPGGKGGNQALAARRAGAQVVLVGAVGRDAFAGTALSLLAWDGVDTSNVAQVAAPTGAAFIAVDASGANHIVVAAGANAYASAHALHDLTLGERDILLLQREVPEAECIIAAQLMKRAGGRVILNLAPARAPAPELLAAVDVLIVNEHEAQVLGRALGWPVLKPDAFARRLDAERRIACIVTLGADGVVGWQGGVRRRLQAPKVEVVDTVAAGDSFVGAFAAALAGGYGFSSALQRGIAAGSLACMVAGAQPSVPRLEQIEALVGSTFL
ncbi:ribokinase [Bosea caraganae]|uniref:Ribokinase n=1 Tax=Bosea caraganae TaxID=2763117 RepID=A0A370L907_9HYPH|nr:ribokinase [Bosea caraganae]RDJ26873.1 ribokinase [Bosea caraganae]RDJ30760.1 ribokinase [Bosea caraganae]